eukprot:s6074_g2.t2
MEMKYKEDLEMKKGELRELKKEFVDATKFDDVLDNAILAMTEIQEEIPECKRLFSEEDPEGEKRRLSLAKAQDGTQRHSEPIKTNGQMDFLWRLMQQGVAVVFASPSSAAEYMEFGPCAPPQGAAKAFSKLASPSLPCELLLLEPQLMGDESPLQLQISLNLPPARCRFAVCTEPHNTNDDIKALLGHGKPWDLLDVDVQGAERTMFTGVMRWLSSRVRRLHLSTHIRVIHWDFVSELESSGWRVVAQYAPLSLTGLQDLGLGRFMTNDGHISAVSRLMLWS